MDTMLIQLTNHEAIKLLLELEKLHLIKVLEQHIAPRPNLSEKYRGILTKEEGQELRQHIEQMRSEWDNI